MHREQQMQRRAFTRADVVTGALAMPVPRGAFDPPTLLGARFTVPCCHNESGPTLASIVDWFNARFALGLRDDEKAGLVAYIEAASEDDEA